MDIESNADFDSTLGAQVTRSNDYVTVFQDEADQWRWNRKAGNHEIISTSGEGYADRSHALDMAAHLNPGIPVSVDEGPE